MRPIITHSELKSLSIIIRTDRIHETLYYTSDFQAWANGEEYGLPNIGTREAISAITDLSAHKHTVPVQRLALGFSRANVIRRRHVNGIKGAKEQRTAQVHISLPAAGNLFKLRDLSYSFVPIEFRGQA